jgi:hypothetical protein
MDRESMSLSPVSDRDAAELARLADALVDEIAVARRRNAELRDVIDAAAGGHSRVESEQPPEADQALPVEAGDTPSADPDPAPPAPVASTPPTGPHAEPAHPDHDADAAGEQDQAHLAAVSMALTGTTREGAREQLRDTFGLDNPDALIDETFGPAPKRRFARLRQRGG